MIRIFGNGSFQNVRLEATENGNHLVIRQATPEAEGVRVKMTKNMKLKMLFDPFQEVDQNA